MFTRRYFLKKSAISTLGAMAIPIIPASAIGKFSPSNRINVAVVGCGRQSVNPNIPQFLSSQNAQVIAVCDVDAWRLGNAVKQVNDYYSKEKDKNFKGCKGYRDFRELLQWKDVDAVMIATPDHWHVPLAIASMRAGKHVSLEKPISTCIEHGRKLVKVAKESKVITRNDSEFRSLPEFSKAVGLVRNGRIGKIQKIYVGVPPEINGEAVSFQPNMQVPDDLDYDMWLGPAWEEPYTENRVHAIRKYGRPGWMRIDRYCNGMISNWGAHLMGIAQWGNNTEYSGPVEVEGSGEFDYGLWNTLKKFEIHYRFSKGVELFYKIERPYVRFEGTEGWIEVTYPDKLSASSLSILESAPGPGEIQFKNLASDKEDFLQAIKTGNPTQEPLEIAYRTVSMCQLGLISIKLNSKLFWDPDREVFADGNNAATALLEVPIREKYFKF